MQKMLKKARLGSDLPATTEVVLALRNVVLALAMAAAPSLN